MGVDYGWAGMFNQADAGLYLTPARAYSPVLGRWLSRDPVGEGADPDGNLYVYVGGEPVYGTDSSGRFGLIGAAIGGVIGGGGNLAYQLFNNGGRFQCVNWGQVGGWALTGSAVGSGLGLLAELGAAGGAAVAAETAAEGAAETTNLYRAVTMPEMESIQSLNAFTNPAGIESKYFATSLEGAQSYASQATAAFGDGPFGFVQTSIPTSSITAEMTVAVDRGIQTVVVSTEQLPSLSAPMILPSP